MRLADLDPRWVLPALHWAGGDFFCAVSFLCPCCRARHLVVPFANPIDPNGYAAQMGEDWLANVVRGFSVDQQRWQRSGETFETLTLTPSVNVSGEGHWHGSITNGVIQ